MIDKMKLPSNGKPNPDEEVERRRKSFEVFKKAQERLDAILNEEVEIDTEEAKKELEDAIKKFEQQKQTPQVEDTEGEEVTEVSDTIKAPDGGSKWAKGLAKSAKYDSQRSAYLDRLDADDEDDK